MEYITLVVTLTSVLCGLTIFKKCAPKAYIILIVTITGVICGLRTFKTHVAEAHITPIARPSRCNMCPTHFTY